MAKTKPWRRAGQAVAWAAAACGLAARAFAAGAEGPAPATSARGALCAAAQARQADYLALWRTEFLRRHRIEPAEMAARVRVDSHEITCDWDSGLAWRVNYTVSYGWARVATHDELVLALYGSTDEYRHLKFPRDQLWPPAEIVRAVDAEVSGAQIQRHDFASSPMFATEAQARSRLVQELGGLTPQRSEFRLLPDNCAKPCTPGHPTLLGHAIVDDGSNLCRSAELDLLTGQATVRDDPCRVS